jgi:uncharacterized repeat protein (TIGR01451 family)
MAFGLALAAGAAERQQLRGRHVPAAVASLAPIGDLPGSQRLNLAIGLPLRNQGELDSLLQGLYDPASPNYHRYLTSEQFTERFGPTEQDYQAVMDFATTNGLTVTVTHPNRVVLDVAGTVADIAKAFHLNLRVYRHPKEARTFYAPDVEPTVDFPVPILHISGLDNYSLPHPNLVARPAGMSATSTPNAGSGPGGTYQGSDFRSAYVPGTSLTGAGQSIGLLQFDGFYANDITTYESQTGLPNVPLTVLPVDGGITNPGSGAVEVSLDIEMVISMAPGLSGIYVYEAPNNLTYMVDLLSRMANDTNSLGRPLCNQLSCSWSGGSANPTAEQLFVQMASQGQSFFNATGDSDAFTGTIPFPSDSPNITEVGGTTLTTGSDTSYSSESAWNWGFDSNCSCYVGSSGGISTFYGIPSYQQGVSMVANLGSTTKRNVPDVALTGDNVYVMYGNGSVQAAGGTSCAAPLWAGFTALVNQQAAALGLPTVGFLNPALYNIGKSASYASCFHDTTAGNNFWPSSPSKFPATTGYDLCTGWGTPNGANLINALAPPPAPIIVSNSFALVAEGCVNGVVDPAETVTMSFGLRNTGRLNTTNLVATLLATGGILSPSGPQTYGVLVTNGTAVTQPFTFTATGSCGDTNMATLQLQDGTADLGTLTFSFRLGQASSTNVFSQNFDGLTAPTLPAGWTSSTSGAQSVWVTSSSSSDTAPNSVFSPEPSSVGLNELDSPTITLPPGSAQLTFRHKYILQSNRDGGVLEIKIGAGAWTDILAAGGSFVSGGYSSTLGTSRSNPLPGRQAWSGSISAFTTTLVNLPAAASGQAIQLRWRCGTDSNTGGTGWYVDTVSITSSVYACCTASADLGVALSALPDPVFAGQNLSYTLTVTNVSGSSASSVTITDTLPVSVTFVSASPGCINLGGTVVCNLGTVAAGSTTNFTVVVTPTAGGLITNTLTVASPTPDPNSANNTAAIVTTVNALPAVTVQPSSQAAIAGANVTFLVNATGTAPLAYQWRFNGTDLADASGASLTVTNVQAAKAGTYTVLVTNIYGSALSSDAVLTLLDPWIVGQPQSQSVAAGAPATFNVSAVGTSPLSYQWFKEAVPLFDGTNITGSQTASLTLAHAQMADAGNYSVMVSNIYGLVVSSNATLTGAFPPVIAPQPVSQVVMAAMVASFTAGAVGASPISYHWQRAGTNLVDGGKLSGTATVSLTVSNIQAAEMGGYSLVASNAYGSVTSSNALLSLWPLVGWGRNDYGEANIPAGLSNVIAVANGLDHSLGLKADGTLVAWGAGTLNTGVSPQQGQAAVPAGLSNVIQAAGGYFHSLALRADGTVVAWGAGSTNTGASPHFGQAIVPVGLSNGIALAAGGFHSLALKSDGTVMAWGAGMTNSGSTPDYGQSIIPVGLTNVIALAAGSYHSLALISDGTVTAWGAGTTNTGSTPDLGQALVPGGLSNVVMTAAGGYHGLALKSDGTVVAWGDNTFGQTNTPGGLSNVVSIAAGRYFSMALKSDGTVIAWGDSAYGQTNVPTGLANMVRIAAGGFHDLALESDGRPSLTVQPVSQTAAAGMTIGLQTMAVGVQPLNYQWQINGTALTGATDRSLSLANVQDSDTGAYRLFVSNSLGTATSAPALVSVQSPPVLSVQPSAQTVISGIPVSFTAAATGTPPLSYQWRLGGSNIIGATLTSYSLASAQPADAGDYSVMVTNAFGAVASTNAALIVLLPPAITAGPSNEAVVVGANASFTVTAAGTSPFAYQWAFDGTNLAGATDDTLVLTNVASAQAGGYAVVITNVAGSVTSLVASLTVSPAATVLSLSLLPGTGVSITFPSEAGINYVLEYKNSLDDTVWTPLPPPTTATSSVTALQDTNTPTASRYYRVRLQ